MRDSKAQKWRKANELCCRFRAMAEELADVRGGLPEASSKSDHDLAIHRSLEEKGLKRYKNKVRSSNMETKKDSKQNGFAGQPGLLDVPPASNRPTSLNSSLLPIRPGSNSSGSPQLIEISNFTKIDFFMNCSCHSATFSASLERSSLISGNVGPVGASQLPLGPGLPV